MGPALTLRKGDPLEPGARTLLEASHALMQEMYPAEANNFLSLEALRAPEITLLLAEEGAEVLGCGALAHKGSYGEVKSMFTAPAARGRGVGALIFAEIEARARAAGLPRLKLETGTGLDAAHRLYARTGFAPCAPFGGYLVTPYTLFFDKALT